MPAMLDSTLTIEVGRTRAAAFAGKLLADAGGEVVAIDDESRRASIAAVGRSYLDVGKQMVTWQPGAESVLVEGLISHADLFVTDLPIDELRSRGLDWESLHQVAPKLCYVLLSPVGPAGEGRTSNGGELAMQALSGVMYMVGDPAREPLALPYSMGSIQLGLHGAAAGAAALEAAAMTGAGHFAEVAGAEVLASYVRIYGAVASYYRIPLRRAGRRAPGSGGRWPFGIFPCRDGYVAMICRSTREWDSLLEMMGDPEWAKQERYQDLYAMAINYPDEIDALVSPWLMQHSRDELLDMAQKYMVPVAPVRNVAEVLADSQLRDYRHFFDQLTTSDGHITHVPGRPWGAGPRVLVERSPSLIDSIGRARSARDLPGGAHA
jgi:crotonobetainyl-CoA:carnitine CoA-transferase CaiB-like acyl-CoA transferase